MVPQYPISIERRLAQLDIIFLVTQVDEGSLSGLLMEVFTDVHLTPVFVMDNVVNEHLSN